MELGRLIELYSVPKTIAIIEATHDARLFFKRAQQPLARWLDGSYGDMNNTA